MFNICEGGMLNHHILQSLPFILVEKLTFLLINLYLSYIVAESNK